MCRGDERGVSALIGAVLLLGIFVTALALYQVNVVPEQNAEVEFNHNERVAGEMQELRNAITNTDRASATRSSSVQLGAQYPDRWVTINPPSPTGTISTQSGTIEFENLEVANKDEYTGPVGGLLDDQDTNTLSYQPNYNEYQQAPVTHIEHSLVFNDFDPELVELTGQQLVDGTNLNLVIVDGEVSETSSGVSSIDVRTVSGPTTPVEIEADEDAVITLPTANADAWEEALDGESVEVNGNGDSVEIELEEGETYTLQMTCVAVGSGGSLCNNDPFDIDRTAEEGDGAAFATVWDEEQEDSNIEEDSTGEADFVIEAGNDATLTMRTSPTASEVPIDFGIDDSGLELESPMPTDDDHSVTRQDGTAEITLTTDSSDEGTVGTVYVWSGGSGDSLEVRVIDEDEEEEENGGDNGGDSPREDPTFDLLEAEEAGNINQIDYEYTMKADSGVTEIEFRGYLGDSTDGDPDETNVVEIESDDDRQGTDRINIGGQGQGSSTFEVVSFEDENEVERCVGTITEDDNSISLSDGGITCS